MLGPDPPRRLRGIPRLRDAIRGLPGYQQAAKVYEGVSEDVLSLTRAVTDRLPGIAEGAVDFERQRASGAAQAYMAVPRGLATMYGAEGVADRIGEAQEAVAGAAGAPETVPEIIGSVAGHMAPYGVAGAATSGMGLAPGLAADMAVDVPIAASDRDASMAGMAADMMEPGSRGQGVAEVIASSPPLRGLTEGAIGLGIGTAVAEGLPRAVNHVRSRDNRGALVNPAGPRPDRIPGEAETNMPGRWYSPTQRAIETFGQDRATGEQWAAAIKKAGRTKNENEWTGTVARLMERAGDTLTRDEALAIARENELSLTEVVRGRNEALRQVEASFEERNTIYREVTRDARRVIGNLTDHTNQDVNRYYVTPLESGEMSVDEAVRGLSQDAGRDVDEPALRSLLTELQEVGEDAREYRRDVRLAQAQGEEPVHGNYTVGQYGRDPDSNYREIAVTLDDGAEEVADWRRPTQRFRPPASHKLPDNTLAHLRTTDREIPGQTIAGGYTVRNRRSGHPGPTVDTEGEARALIEGYPESIRGDLEVVPVQSRPGRPDRTLFIEEIQSDWHQAGRERGYQDPNTTRVRETTLARMREIEESIGVDAAMADGEWADLQARLVDLNNSAGVPAAPFDKTDEWVGLMVRRAIQEAVDGGYDRIAWVNGEQAADFYDLRHQVSKIEWHPESHALQVFDTDGYRVEHNELPSRATPEELPGIIGKEPAARLVEASEAERAIMDTDVVEYLDGYGRDLTFEENNALQAVGDRMMDGESWDDAVAHFAGEDPEIDEFLDRVRIDMRRSTEGWRSIEGDDLQVGGRGMDTFYNRIVPNAVTKELKRYGVEVEPVRIGEGDGAPTNLSVRIPPEVAERIKRDGLRMGATTSEVVESLAGAAVGGTVGAADSPEDRKLQGFALGAAGGAAVPGALRGIGRHARSLDNRGAVVNPIGAPAVTRGSDAPLFDTSAPALERSFIEDAAQGPIDYARVAKGARLERLRRRFTPARRRALIQRADEIRSQIPAAQFWYATEPLRARFIGELGEAEGVDAFNLFMQRVAATSPRTAVLKNVIYASQNRPVMSTQAGLLSAVNEGRAMGTPPGIGAPKVRSFDENLRGNLEPTTFDVHMTNVIGGPEPNSSIYGEYARKFSMLAEEAGMPPAMLQSTLWHDGPTLVDPAPFLEMVDRAVARAAKRQGVTNEEAMRRFIRGDEALGATVHEVLESLMGAFLGGTVGAASAEDGRKAEGALLGALGGAAVPAAVRSVGSLDNRGHLINPGSRWSERTGRPLAEWNEMSTAEQTSAMKQLDRQGRDAAMGGSTPMIGNSTVVDPPGRGPEASSISAEGANVRDAATGRYADRARVLSGDAPRRGSTLPGVAGAVARAGVGATLGATSTDDPDEKLFRAAVGAAMGARGKAALQDVATLRRALLLYNPATQVVNLGGNAAQFGMDSAARGVASVVDEVLLSRITGERAVGGTTFRDLAEASDRAFGDGLEQAKKVLKEGQDPDELAKLDIEQTGGRLARAAMEPIGRLLSAGDRVFWNATYGRSISEQARVMAQRAVDSGMVFADESLDTVVDGYIQNPTAQMQVLAAMDAAEAVYQDPSKLRDAVKTMRSGFESVGGGAATAIFDILVPYQSTPSNIVTRALQYSPAGFAQAATDIAALKRFVREGSDALEGTITPNIKDQARGIRGVPEGVDLGDELLQRAALQRRAATAVGRATIGSGVFALGVIAYQRGWWTGEYPDDAQSRNEMSLTGETTSSIDTGDGYLSMGRIGPLAVILNMGAETARMMEAGEASPLALAGLAVDQVNNSPFGDARAAQALFSEGAGTQNIERAAADVAGSLVPAPVGAIARNSDVVRERRRGSMVDAVKYNLPGLRQTLPKRIDAIGREVGSSNNLLRGISTTVNPFPYRAADDDPVVQLIAEVGASVPDARASLRNLGVELGTDEYEQYARVYGDEVYQEILRAQRLPRFTRAQSQGDSETMADEIEKAARRAKSRTTSRIKRGGGPS